MSLAIYNPAQRFAFIATARRAHSLRFVSERDAIESVEEFFRELGFHRRGEWHRRGQHYEAEYLYLGEGR